MGSDIAKQPKKENLKIVQNNEKVLNVITLNYSGILLNPFQFYQGKNVETQKQQARLSSIFQDLLRQHCEHINKDKPYDKKTFKWNIGQIDKKMQKLRYSPLYNPAVGVVNKKLVNQTTFKELWSKTYQENVQKVFKNTAIPKKQQVQEARTFDWLCFLSIVSYLYKTTKPQEAKYSQTYQTFMNKMFSKPFLNEQAKLNLTLKALQSNQIDIAFIQESNHDLVKVLKQTKKYVVYSTQKAESIIVAKSQQGNTKFTNFHKNQKVFTALFQNQKEEDHNWNSDTMYAMIDKYILICAHLSSKEEKNKLQRDQMYSYLTKLKKKYPAYGIILGADANAYLQFQDKQFHQFPKDKNQITTRKKRTFLQPQVKKAGQVAQSARDFIVTTLNIREKNSMIMQVNGELVQNRTVLPNQNHPYDHFAIKIDFIKTELYIAYKTN